LIGEITVKCLIIFSLVLAIPLVTLLGCGAPSTDSKPVTEEAADNAPPADEVAEVRSQLAPEDQALVEAQEWCVVSTSERLGSMGPPIKLDIEGTPVFICCAGCKRKAEANPQKTLAKLAELKEKAKAKNESGA
jgi:hypothetical protein